MNIIKLLWAIEACYFDCDFQAYYPINPSNPPSCEMRLKGECPIWDSNGKEQGAPR